MMEQASPTSAPASAGGNASPGGPAVLELHVAQMRQLFNAMDPAPFRERDLDPNAVAYIVDWGRETRAGEPLRLVVHLGSEVPAPDSQNMLREAVHVYFEQRALATRRQLRKLFRVGRVSLVIGLAVLGGAIMLGELVAGLVSKENYSSIIKESFVIGGWVALWRPLEIFLYDWWPIRAEAKLLDRLSAMEVRVLGNAAPTGAAA